jgi:hypothetical protein
MRARGQKGYENVRTTLPLRRFNSTCLTRSGVSSRFAMGRELEGGGVTAFGLAIVRNSSGVGIVTMSDILTVPLFEALTLVAGTRDYPPVLLSPPLPLRRPRLPTHTTNG